MDPVIVVGGGAAGIIAAWRSAGLQAPTLLLEKNERLGIKLHISGGGKCNITHAGLMHDIRMAFEPNEARFLRLPFLRFTNEDVLALLHERGVETYTRPDGRIFPVSGRAEDVVEALAWHAGHAGAEIRCGSVVERLEAAGGKVHGIWMQGRSHRASAVILATGGVSYPKTGTTGEGLRWARELGHSLVPLRAALAPIYLDPAPPADWSGVAVRDCLLRARAGGKVISRWRSDLLFTHKGISGPTALGVSRDVALALEHGPATLDADLLPDRPPEDLAAELTSAEHYPGAGRSGSHDTPAPTPTPGPEPSDRDAEGLAPGRRAGRAVGAGRGHRRRRLPGRGRSRHDGLPECARPLPLRRDPRHRRPGRRLQPPGRVLYWLRRRRSGGDGSQRAHHVGTRGQREVIMKPEELLEPPGGE